MARREIGGRSSRGNHDEIDQLRRSANGTTFEFTIVAEQGRKKKQVGSNGSRLKMKGINEKKHNQFSAAVTIE